MACWKKWVFIYEWTGYESVGAIHKFIKTWTKFFHFGLCSISFVCYYFQSAYCDLSVVRLTEWSQTESFAQKKLYAVLCILIFNETIFMNEKLRRTIAYGSTKRNETNFIRKVLILCNQRGIDLQIGKMSKNGIMKLCFLRFLSVFKRNKQFTIQRNNKNERSIWLM